EGKLAKRSVDRIGEGVVKHGIAVRCRPGGDAFGNGAACAWTVFDHNGLAQVFTHFLGNDACCVVGTAAGGVRNDQAYRLSRKVSGVDAQAAGRYGNRKCRACHGFVEYKHMVSVINSWPRLYYA